MGRDVAGLEGHAQREGEIGEIPIIGLLLARNIQPPAIPRLPAVRRCGLLVPFQRLGVEEIGIMQRVDDVGEGPRQRQRDKHQREGKAVR
jgi:hypothetical protein